MTKHRDIVMFDGDDYYANQCFVATVDCPDRCANCCYDVMDHYNSHCPASDGDDYEFRHDTGKSRHDAPEY